MSKTQMPEMTEKEWAERKRRLDERLANYTLRPAKPKPVAVVSVPVSQRDAEVIAGNPESVRVSARREDGVTVLAKPERNSQNVTVRIDWVHEVNAQGQPIYDEPGAVSDYHPWSGLRR
jgi:hypothetical protein